MTRTRLATLLSFVCACAIAACDSSAPSGSGGAGGGSGGAGGGSGGSGGSGGGLPPPTNGVQITTPSFTLNPGEEVFKCFFTSLATNTDVAAVKFASTMAPGSHHFILYTTQNPIQPDNTFIDCGGGMGGNTTQDPPVWLYASQDPMHEMDMPSGVAMPLKAHQPLIFNMHYINTGSTPKTVQVVQNIEYATGNYMRAGAFVTFNTMISIPPNGTQTVSGHCTVPQGVNFFTMSTHSHKRTVTAQANRYMNGTVGAPLVMTTDWAHATISNWDNPFLTLNAGEEIYYSCSYQNDTNQTISVGESAETNEMCMAVGYYFPATGNTFCLNSFSIQR